MVLYTGFASNPLQNYGFAGRKRGSGFTGLKDWQDGMTIRSRDRV
jgi:hypothetical protein